VLVLGAAEDDDLVAVEDGGVALRDPDQAAVMKGAALSERERVAHGAAVGPSLRVLVL
jgi:hypothetical protein